MTILESVKIHFLLITYHFLFCSVDLKYVFVAQKFAIYYEGRKRVFHVVEISEDKANDLGEVARALSNLKLNISTPTLWTCGWEVQVTIKNTSDVSNKDKVCFFHVSYYRFN